MATKRPTRKSAPKKSSRKTEDSQSSPLRRAGGAIVLILALVVSVAILTRIYIDPTPPPQSGTVPRTETGKKVRVSIKTPEKRSTEKSVPPSFEVFPKREIPHTPVATDRPKPHRPRIAIIIDDIGFDSRAANRLMDLDVPVTLSVLPYAPQAIRIAKTARKRNTELMLHLPMEPVQYPKIDPGKGALFSTMDPDRLIAVTKADIKRIPGIKGVNNHMGSKLTAQSDKMNQVFTVLKKEGLFFIDSRTTKDSACAASARLFRVPFAQRDVFFDHVRSKAQVHRQFDKLIRIAEKHGYAVGIGHPYDVTLKMLEARTPKLKNRYDWVFASSLVHPVL